MIIPRDINEDVNRIERHKKAMAKKLTSGGGGDYLVLVNT